MSRAYIYKVTVHVKQTVHLGGYRNVNIQIEENRSMYFNTSLAAHEFMDKVEDEYGWKCSLVWDIMFDDSRQGMKDALMKFDEDVRDIVTSVSPVQYLPTQIIPQKEETLP
jgi:hypothetical protein